MVTPGPMCSWRFRQHRPDQQVLRATSFWWGGGALVLISCQIFTLHWKEGMTKQRVEETSEGTTREDSQKAL